MEQHPLHPSTIAILRFFEFEHLPFDSDMRNVSEQFSRLAHEMATELSGTPHGAELTTGLRKLLEAKDCLVRATLPR